MKTLMILLLLITPCFAGTIQVNTGYGYFVDTGGNITDKALLPIGTHPIKDGYSYVEVASQGELGAINVYVPPPTIEDQKMALQYQIDSLATQITNAMADGDDAKVAELRTQRNALKTQLNNLG